jgi:predicted cupin superfamily sugar epimerase
MTVVELLEEAGEGVGYRETVLGSDVLGEQLVQYVVKRNTWFGSFANPGSDYSFVGCTVSPGFVFEDFELASRADLLARFPRAAAQVINDLTEGLP